MQNLILRGEDLRRHRSDVQSLSRSKLGLDPTTAVGEVVRFRGPKTQIESQAREERQVA